jgi:voltage-gated potassium channel
VTITEAMRITLEARGVGTAARVFRIAHGAALSVGLAAVVLGTVPSIVAAEGRVLDILAYAVLAFFTLEYAARIAIAPHLSAWRGRLSISAVRWRWMVSTWGIIDLLAWLPSLAALLLADDPTMARLFGVVWVLKLARHSPRLGLLARVLRQAREPLLAVFFAFLIILIFAATFAYLVEGEAQPDTFGTIPEALWWAITTLTTTGYGDAVPATPLGRTIAGGVMVCGIILFALWAGILATEFALEMRRHEFLRTWDLVAKVPYFRDVSATVIAEVASLLKPRDYASHSVIMRRGDPGDCMFFIVEGEIEVELKPTPIRLGPGEFVGEIALITGGPRTATVIARKKAVLLELDIADFRLIAARHPELTRAIDQEAANRVERARTATGHAE